MDNKHKHFWQKQNETDFDPNGKFGYLVLILSLSKNGRTKPSAG